MPDGANIYDVCNLIKQFFRELEEPLLTDELEPEFLKFHTLSEGDDDGKFRFLLDLCQVLPPTHKNTLSFLMHHLKRVFLGGFLIKYSWLKLE